jgi:hypothetical protein
MPTITKVQCHPTPASVEHPVAVDVSISLITPGPVTIHLALDGAPHYFFITGGKQVRELLFTRMFPSAGDHTTRFTLSLMRLAPDEDDLALTIRAAGIDGSSLPVTMLVGVS